ncbi:MAG: hypothetical protein LBD79_08400 [Treponema sp.]|jgi:hypothetical protein|nr:hypothetical protein [Treponema sp.]
MTRAYRRGVIAALLLLPLCVWARGQADDVVEVTGRVRLVGNVPFAEFVITDANEQDWYIDTDSHPVLATYEQRVITVRGVLELLDLVLANGRRVGMRRVLHNVRLVEAPL